MTGQVLDASWLFGGPRLPHFFSDIYTETEWDPPGLAVSMAANVATLTWSASPTAGVTSYDLYRRTPPTGAVFVPGSDTPVATGVTSPYADSGLSSATYEWQVFGNLTAWTPASVTGLTAWYDASDTGSITDSGGAVSQVNDLSGNGNHAVQGTGSHQPTTGANTVNSLNVLTMGHDKFLTATLGSSVSQEFSLFLVVKLTTFLNYGMLFGNAVQSSAAAGIITRSSPALGFRADGSSAVSASASVTTGTTYAIVADFNGASSSITVAGVTDTGISIGTNIIGTELDIGSSYGGQNDSMDGYWCEGFLKAGAAGADGAAFIAYASSKWGAT